VSASQSKTRTAIPVPLNAEAAAIIARQIGKHIEFVFTYEGNPVKQCNTAAWRKALKRAKIEACLTSYMGILACSKWNILTELQILGGWSSFDIVLRYAHLNSDQLMKAAERVSGTKLVHSVQTAAKGG
jgi:hypothetical protein